MLKQVIGTIVRTFARLRNKVRNKEKFLRAPKCKSWFETELPVHKSRPASSSTVSEYSPGHQAEKKCENTSQNQVITPAVTKPHKL
jgi:hypothetical protein